MIFLKYYFEKKNCMKNEIIDWLNRRGTILKLTNNEKNVSIKTQILKLNI